MIIDRSNIVRYITKALDFYNHKEYLQSEAVYIEIFKHINFIFPELYLGYANTLIALHKYKEAIQNFHICLDYDKNIYEAYFGIAISYEKLSKKRKAVQFYKKTIQHKSSFIPAYNNLANLYQNIYQYKKAKRTYFLALQYDNKQSKTLDNLGTLYQSKNKHKKAISYHKLAIKYNKKNFTAYFNYSLALLMLGKKTKGFKYYEYRLKMINSFANNLSDDKRWKGKKIKNKSLFIFTEQGLGDSIQFIRYIKYIKHFSQATILFKCQRGLISLFKNIKEIDFIIEDSKLPHFDYYLPLLSSTDVLNKHLSYIPNETPYLTYTKKHDLLSSRKFKVGLVWRGSSKNSNNNTRSIPLSKLAPILEIKRCQFYSLQKEEVTIEELKKYNIFDLGERINDFNDTANYINQLDLIISIDTAVAHLALSLNKKTWVLLSHVSDYRWSKKTPQATWYSNAIIYKEKRLNNNWERTIKEVKSDLIKEVELFKCF